MEPWGEGKAKSIWVNKCFLLSMYGIDIEGIPPTNCNNDHSQRQSATTSVAATATPIAVAFRCLQFPNIDSESDSDRLSHCRSENVNELFIQHHHQRQQLKKKHKLAKDPNENPYKIAANKTSAKIDGGNFLFASMDATHIYRNNHRMVCIFYTYIHTYIHIQQSIHWKKWLFRF